MPALDVARARALTPGCERVLHLNHAGASLLPQPVLDAVVDHLRLEAEVGGYEAADAAQDRIRHTYTAAAELVGGRPSEIALVDSHTTAWNAVVHALGLRPGDRVVVTRSEYGSNAIVLHQLHEQVGCELVVVDSDEHGQIDLDGLAWALDQGRVAFVSLVHAPTGNGLVEPAADVGRLCRAAGVPLVLDACQSVGQLPVDVDAIGCDALAASGRKFLRGPRGTGFLWVRSSLLDQLQPRTLDLHAATWTGPGTYEVRPGMARFEQFEADVAARIGLGVAIDHALGWGLEQIEARVVPLAEGLRGGLAAIPGVAVHDTGVRRSGIVTFSVEEVPATDVRDRLRADGINVSVTTPEYAQLDLPHRGLGDLVRASVHYVNTAEEVARATAAVAAIAGARAG